MDDTRQILTYTLREELGHDRLGRVFRAVDARTMTGIVLRILRVGALVPPARVEPVRTELRRRLRAAANVAHPNLAPIVEIVPHLDLDLVAWDDFGGVPVARRLAEGVPAVESLRWAIEAASAIARAHAREVPHGRISLSNIMVARDDGVRVLDLGVPRPKEIPFLVDDDPEDGEPRPAKRDLPKLMRRDIEALAGVLGEMVGAGPDDAPDRSIREEIAAAVEQACEEVLAQPKPSAAKLHLALVDVARRTPADGRSGRLLESPPAPRAPIEPPRPAPAPPARPERADPLPFALSDYENTREGGLRRASASAAVQHRAWGGAAFEPEAPEEKEPEREETVPAFDPREPPRMTTVLLPPLDPDDDGEGDGQSPPARRLWTRVLAAGIIGMLATAGLLAVDRSDPAGNAAVPELPPVPAASEIDPADADPAPARPVARRGQPAGTLVITAAGSDVRASVDGGPFEGVPLRWDDVPAGRHIVRVTAPGFEERVDTVMVRADLTTTRFFILAPAR